MNSTTARMRLLTALLMIVGSFSLALVAESATAARPFKVSLNVSNSTPSVGQTVKFGGKVTPAAPGKRVKVQGKAAGTGWVTIKSPVLSRRSTFNASFQFSRAGNVQIRVVKPRSGKSAQGISQVRRLRVGGGTAAPVIITTSLPNGAVGTPYSATVETADDRPGAFGAIGLPTGLGIDAQTGEIAGTPTTAGSKTVKVFFRDADNRTTSKEFTIVIGGRGLPNITTTGLPNGQVGVAYSTTLAVANNLDGRWAVAGSLPAGLTLNTTTGVISGTPTTAATSSFTATFTETSTGFNDVQALSIRIASSPGPVITTTSLPPGYVGHAYSATLAVSGAAGSWSLTAGALPAGLTLNSATGVISGTPTHTSATPVTSTFTVTYTVPGGLLGLPPARSDSQPLKIKIDPNSAPVVSNTSLSDAFVGDAYRNQLTTADNRSGTWAVTSGTLPAGISLNGDTGEISGVPNQAGTSTFIVTFTALNGLTDTEDFTLLVRP